MLTSAGLTSLKRYRDFQTMAKNIFDIMSNIRFILSIKIIVDFDIFLVECIGVELKQTH